jgi:hypothetical protein
MTADKQGSLHGGLISIGRPFAIPSFSPPACSGQVELLQLTLGKKGPTGLGRNRSGLPIPEPGFRESRQCHEAGRLPARLVDQRDPKANRAEIPNSRGAEVVIV